MTRTNGFALTLLICVFGATGATAASRRGFFSGRHVRMVSVYECKPDGTFGRLWWRWQRVERIPARDIPSHSLTCVKPQVAGKNICHDVRDEDQNSVPCNRHTVVRHAFGQ
jgi:hypothetical protein